MRRFAGRGGYARWICREVRVKKRDEVSVAMGRHFCFTFTWVYVSNAD